MRLVIVLLVLAVSATPGYAVNPDEMLDDPALEARARDLSEGLRCVVCRNQNIDSSNATIARDMRLILRERLVAGDTDEEAVRYLVNRFGEYVLLNPPLRPSTYILWASPFVLLIITLAGFALFLRRRVQANDDLRSISDEDAALLADVLGEDKPT